MGLKPTAENHDFNCTLPISYYSIDENTTVAIGESNYISGSVCVSVLSVALHLSMSTTSTFYILFAWKFILTIPIVLTQQVAL